MPRLTEKMKCNGTKAHFTHVKQISNHHIRNQMKNSSTIDTSNTEAENREMDIKQKILDTVPVYNTHQFWIQPQIQFTIPIQTPQNKYEKNPTSKTKPMRSLDNDWADIIKKETEIGSGPCRRWSGARATNWVRHMIIAGGGSEYGRRRRGGAGRGSRASRMRRS